MSNSSSLFGRGTYKHNGEGQKGIDVTRGLDSSKESHEPFNKLYYTRIFRMGAAQSLHILLDL
jgi:hypothetical protein